jgi:hypothetical protein
MGRTNRLLSFDMTAKNTKQLGSGGDTYTDDPLPNKDKVDTQASGSKAI